MLDVSRKLVQEEGTTVSAGEKFVLGSEPVDFQITKHMMNIIAAFHPSNIEVSIPNIYKGFGESVRLSHEVIAELTILLVNPLQAEFYLEIYDAAPLEFRLAQLIQYYGAEKMAAWLKTFYGKEVNSYAELSNEI